jgi:hypothetical protein
LSQMTSMAGVEEEVVVMLMRFSLMEPTDKA